MRAPGFIHLIAWTVSAIGLFSPDALAQKLSFGVVAGGSITKDFAPQFSLLNPSVPSFHSGSQSYVIGPLVEYAFTHRFSVEANGINKLLHATGSDVGPDGSFRATSTFPVVTWQFPILAKYRFAVDGVRPFVELGPSVRTAGNLNGTKPSNHGISTGAGFEVYWHGVRIGPTVRYTRWARDNNSGGPLTKPDQVEVLVALSHRSAADSRPFGKRLSFGVVTGTTLTGDYRTRRGSFVVGSEDPISPPGPGTFRSFSDSRSLLIGAMAELKLPLHFSLKADALYRTLHSSTELTYSDRTIRTGGGARSDIWEVPVLVQYSIPVSSARAFVAAGPSFRTPGGYNDPHHGITGAAGIETSWGRLRVTPQVRYTRWASDGDPETFVNQAQILIGFAF
jgi:hypothetical protein